MNERIKVLMLEAGYAAPKIAGRGQKLAELIVRECAEWIKNTDSDPDIGEEDAKALLEHFGVKE